MFKIYLTFSLILFTPLLVKAEVYKCVDNKNKVTYSQTPCNNVKSITKLDVEKNSQYSTNNQNIPTKSPIIKQLDASVAGAIARGDIEYAERLAVTAEQWNMINEAKINNKKNADKPLTGRTEADLSADKGKSFECESARRNYEMAASTEQYNTAKLEARQSVMRQACGMREPTEINNTTGITVNNRVHIRR
ncbi:MAG: DUF4124 domain-containing protein [Methylotenera sp.]|nr:DUF4124 domain-containing protein [Methylotenera sp.]MDD4925837.1 DUF4124 domain-containing protein [Methylotenera sp.]